MVPILAFQYSSLLHFVRAQRVWTSLHHFVTGLNRPANTQRLPGAIPDRTSTAVVQAALTPYLRPGATFVGHRDRGDQLRANNRQATEYLLRNWRQYTVVVAGVHPPTSTSGCVLSFRPVGDSRPEISLLLACCEWCTLLMGPGLGWGALWR